MTLSLAYIVKVVAPSKVPKVLFGGHCSQKSYEQKKFHKQIFFFRQHVHFFCVVSV